MGADNGANYSKLTSEPDSPSEHAQKRIPHLLKMCPKIKHVQTFAKHVHQFGLGGTVTKNLILKQ